ncbi:MAG: DUF3307 domain-containing protein [bacterium]
MADLFLRAFLAHIVSDVLLQPDILSKKKRDAGKWLIAHGIITLIALLFFGWAVSPYLKWALFSILTSISHYFVDFFRIKRGKKSILISILDQALHFAFMGLFLFIFFRLVP